MQLTDFHAKYFAYELTKRCASDSVEKLVPVLADAQVDLNPHQVEAALFAFRSPFSKGAIVGAQHAAPLQAWDLFDGPANQSRRCPHFSVEMETGTGKTYVYLRTIFELSRRYGF